MLKTGRGLEQLTVQSHTHHLQLMPAVSAEQPAWQNQNFHSQPIKTGKLTVIMQPAFSYTKTTVHNITTVVDFSHWPSIVINIIFTGPYPDFTLGRFFLGARWGSGGVLPQPWINFTLERMDLVASGGSVNCLLHVEVLIFVCVCVCKQHNIIIWLGIQQ